MLGKPGLVMGIHDKDKSVVDVQIDTGILKAKNMLPNIVIGDYVVVLDDVVIQIISEKQADKMMKA